MHDLEDRLRYEYHVMLSCCGHYHNLLAEKIFLMATSDLVTRNPGQ